VPCAYRSKYITNHTKKTPNVPKIQPKGERNPQVNANKSHTTTPTEEAEAERRRKSTVERRKEKFGDIPARPTKSPKDKTKYAQRVLLQKQRFH
jgi:hypothetical protein